MPDILAAGVVTFRTGREVLLVHRPRYDDWSFPKGKLDRGEHRTTAAVREVEEETGLRVRLGPPVPDQRYPVGQRMKRVHYWAGRVVGDDDVTRYRTNAEIDQVAWVPVSEAAERLTHVRDRATLRAALAVRRSTRALVVLRHGEARDRSAWRGEDPLRPLVRAGQLQARRMVPLLAAYDVTRMVSSTSTRCLQTLQPYADEAGRAVAARAALSEERATPAGVARIVESLLETRTGAVVCTHRPVLPWVYDAAGIVLAPDAEPLAPAEMLVLHVRKGAVVAVERHYAD